MRSSLLAFTFCAVCIRTYLAVQHSLKTAKELQTQDILRSSAVELRSNEIIYTPPTICVTRRAFNETPKGKARPCKLIPCDSQSSKINADQGFFLNYTSLDARANSTQQLGSARDGSGCAISHVYKFIYIHVLKSGGNTIKAFLQKALCLANNTKKCLDKNRQSKLEIVDCELALQKHGHEYFVWSFVRNPFARLYSGYAMASNPRHRKMDFDFETFALANKQQRSKLSIIHESHFVPQSQFLFDSVIISHQCPVVDFVGRLEHLERDLRIVLGRIQSPELDQYFRNIPKGKLGRFEGTSFGYNLRNNKHLINVDSIEQDSDEEVFLADIYREPKIRKKVAWEQAVDFDLLGYNK